MTMKTATFFLTATLIATIAFPAYPQEALEEIVVTAQRREQNLQDVPVSVTAFTGAAVEQGNIRAARDYLALTPNVAFTDDGQVGSKGLGVAIRGVIPAHLERTAFGLEERVGLVAGRELHQPVAVGVGVLAEPGVSRPVPRRIHPRYAVSNRPVQGPAHAVLVWRRAVRRTVPRPR